MKIITTITVRVERPDGTFTQVTRARRTTAGDNPSFERMSTHDAVLADAENFVEHAGLGGTSPL